MLYIGKEIWLNMKHKIVKHSEQNNMFWFNQTFNQDTANTAENSLALTE